MSWLTNLRGVVGTLFKIGKADFDSTAVTSPRTLALRDIAGTVALLSDITTYGRSLQEITPTSEGQTVFTVPGGYAVGSTDFLVNGVQLRTTEFTATDGTTVTISAGLSTTDLLTAVKWGNGGATSFTTTAASATAGQTAFTVPIYPTGLSAMAVYRNGVRLTPTTDFVETNSTTVTLTSAADLNDDMLFISGTPVGSFGTMATQNASSVAITGGNVVGITDLAIADGGTGASTASGARTNLGLGSIATQDATNVNIDGGAIDGAAIGGNSAAAATFSSVTAPAYMLNDNEGVVGDSGSGPYFVLVKTGSAGAEKGSLLFTAKTGGVNEGALKFRTYDGSTVVVNAVLTRTARFLLNTEVDNGADQIQANGHIATVTAGNGYKTKEGSNAKQGTAVLVAGTVTVSNTSVTANSRIFLTSNTDGGTPGFVRVSARTAGTSFTITSSSGTDTSTIAYEIFEPA